MFQRCSKHVSWISKRYFKIVLIGFVVFLYFFIDVLLLKECFPRLGFLHLSRLEEF